MNFLCGGGVANLARGRVGAHEFATRPARRPAGRPASDQRESSAFGGQGSCVLGVWRLESVIGDKVAGALSWSSLAALAHPQELDLGKILSAFDGHKLGSELKWASKLMRLLHNVPLAD